MDTKNLKVLKLELLKDKIDAGKRANGFIDLYLIFLSLYTRDLNQFIKLVIVSIY